MEEELVYAAGAAGIATANFAVAYFAIVRPYRAERRKGSVRSFGDYWEEGIERFSELMNRTWF